MRPWRGGSRGIVATVVTEPAPVVQRPISNVARVVLLGAIVVTVLLYAIPGGEVIARPLVWVSTLAHELGHAGAAAAVGGDVDSVHVFTDGSGVAVSTRPPGRLRTAAIAAGGLVGPALVSALLFAVSRSRRVAKPAAVVLSLGLAAAIVFALRGWLAITVALVLALMLAGSALRGPPLGAQIVMVFLAVQLALSVFSRGDYLFTPTAMTAVGPGPSDSAQIAEALIGPYWLWGALCGLLSVLVLAVGVVTFLHRAGSPRSTPADAAKTQMT